MDNTCAGAINAKSLSPNSYTLEPNQGTVLLFAGQNYLSFFDYTDTTNCPLQSCELLRSGGGQADASSFTVSSTGGITVDTT